MRSLNDNELGARWDGARTVGNGKITMTHKRIRRDTNHEQAQ